MGDFKPNISKSDKDIIELNSIICLESILSHNDLRTHFSVNDKNANIDGTIELLNNRRIIGKIVVQIKTYPKKYYGKSKFDFPTSLFAYAKKIPTDVVFLLAVDKKNNIGYWKYINNSLIRRHSDKSSQKTINISFEDSEIVNSNNIDLIIIGWKKIYRDLANLVELSEINNSENEQLRKLVSKIQSPILSIDEKEVINLQKFIDKYNYLLDHDYSAIKRYYYENSWKIGIAIFEYSIDSLSYMIYRIPYGSNDLLIKEIPLEKVKELVPFARIISQNCAVNGIKKDPEAYAYRLVGDDVNKLLENRNLLFLTQEISTEYIFDFIKKEGHYLELNLVDILDLLSFKKLLEAKYPMLRKNISCLVTLGHRDINIDILYRCICFLLDQGVDKLQRMYPPKGQYGNSGLVYDWYTSQLAYEKTKFVFERIPYIFYSYMEVMFPELISKIDFFDGCNLLLVNLIYSDKDKRIANAPQIVLYYLHDIKKSNDSHEVITSLNFESEIFRENNIVDNKSMNNLFSSQNHVHHRNNEYDILKSEGCDMGKFFGEYYIHNLLYKYLDDRFKSYFESVNIN